jgi:hypothetical protein
MVMESSGSCMGSSLSRVKNKYHKTGICCCSVKYASLTSSTLVVSESGLCPGGLLYCLGASTIKYN